MKNKNADKNQEFISLQIVTTNGTVQFDGKFRRDLETPNWHYYEKPSGKLAHFRKEHMVAVFELDDVEPGED